MATITTHRRRSNCVPQVSRTGARGAAFRALLPPSPHDEGSVGERRRCRRVMDRHHHPFRQLPTPPPECAGRRGLIRRREAHASVCCAPPAGQIYRSMAQPPPPPRRCASASLTTAPSFCMMPSLGKGQRAQTIELCHGYVLVTAGPCPPVNSVPTTDNNNRCPRTAILRMTGRGGLPVVA